MKNKLKKILGILLSVTIISNSVDLTALKVQAAEGAGENASIIAFDALTETVRNQTVGVGQTESDIMFPDNLQAMVKKTITVQTPVEKLILVENVSDSVSSGDIGEEVGVSDGDAMPEVTYESVIEMVDETKVVEESVVINVLGWNIDAANSVNSSFVADESTCGYSYTYVPELDLSGQDGNALVIAEGVAVPGITVTIGPAVEGAGTAKFTVNYYVEVEPGSDPRAIAKTNPKNSSETKYFLHMEQLAVNYTEGKVVRSAYGVDTGAQMVSDVAASSTISSTRRNYDYAEPAHDYNNVTGSETNGGEGTVTADASLTFNFYWKTATYSEYHLVDAETTSYDSGLISYNGKYYKILKTNEVKVTAENVNTTVTIPDLSGTGEFEAYTALTSQSSTYPTSGTLDSLGQLCLYRFYDKCATTSYTEQYFVEDPNATENYITVLVGSELITYRLHHENIVENAYVGSTATIEDLSGTPAFSGYTLVDRTGQGYYPSRTVQEDNRTYVYQFYDQNPTCNYSVVYYVEVYEHQKDGSNITVNVNGTDKYYNRIPNSAYNMACQAPEGTIITVADSSSDVPGVYAGGVKVSKTWQAYTSTLRKYSYDTTVAYGKHTGTVAADGSLQIVLFYDWIETTPTTAKYTTKYYAELADQGVDYGFELIDGVKYELLGEYEKTGTIGEEAVIEDISTQEPYKSDYELMPATDTYPSKANIAVDNSTVLYQIYRLHPQYMITYYKETENGTVPVGDKKYTMENYLIKRMPKGTTISYLELENGAAAAAVDGSAIDGTTKSYDGYEFSVNATGQRGKGSFTVTRGGDNLIELFFDKIVPTTTYTEEYYVELYEQSATTYDLLVDGRKYELKESKTVTAELDATVSITDLSATPTYSSYVLMPATSKYPSQVVDVADDGTTRLYQIYRRMPMFAVWYYLEVEEGESGTIVQVGERYYKKMSPDYASGTSKGMSFNITENADGTAAVWMILNDVSTEYETRFNGEYLPDGYVFDADATYSRKQYPYLMELDKDTSIEVFYKKVPTTAEYEEHYYVELEEQSASACDLELNGVKYKLQESNTKTIEKDLGAKITDKSTQSPYVEYELQPATTTHPSEVDNVADDNTTILYQLYRLQPKYTVRYYKEADAGAAGAVKVGSKYYVLAESQSGEARSNSTITFAERTDGTVGIAVNTMECDATFKSYANYVFDEDTTVLNNKVSATVTRDAENVIELFFDKARTASYKCEYYVELKNQDSTDFDKKIAGVKYELKDSYAVAGVAFDARIEIADKSDEYAELGYDLMPETQEHPSWSTQAKSDGTTVLYQIYRLRPTYTVHYYTEVDNETSDSIEICGKYYVKQVNDSVIKFAEEGTVVTYAEKSDKEAGVAEDGGGVADTLRSYDGYLFSSVAGRVNGKVMGTVTRDLPVVIELFFDRIRADYTEKYWIEKPDAVSDYIEVKVEGTVRKFVLAKINVVEDEWINSKVSIMDRTSEFEGYRMVYEVLQDYSSVSYGILADGSTAVHQFFLLEDDPVNEPPVANVPKPNPWQKSNDDEIKSPKTGDKNNRGFAILTVLAGYIALLLKRRVKAN